MMLPAITKQVPFVAINVGLLCFAWLLLVEPVLNVFGDQTNRLQEQLQLQRRYRAMIAREPAIVAAKANVEAMTASNLFLVGGSGGALNAALQARLKALAERAGVRVQTIRSLAPQRSGTLWFVGAHLGLDGRIGAVRDLLHQIELDRPMLFVEKVAFRIPPSAPGALVTEEPRIDVQIDVEAPARDYAPSR